MRVPMLLSMAASGFGERIAVGLQDDGLSYATLDERSRRAASWLRGRAPGGRVPQNVVLVDVNSDAVPIVFFGSGLAGLPFVPLNYRLADDRLRALLERTAPAVAIVDDRIRGRVGPIEGVEFVERGDFLAALPDDEPADDDPGMDADQVAVLLFTSGTTGDPKAAVLRHRHLTSYVVTTVDFMGADPDEATLVSVPPYHVAGISSVLSSTFAGRRIVYLDSFTPESWVSVARRERITHAMVVPTMLGRILDVLRREDEALPHLRHLSYGGGRMPTPVVEEAMELLPHVGFVNAYGLTETSSTITVLTPEDHTTSFHSSDPRVRRRLASVGRPVPGVTVTIRGPSGEELGAGAEGEVWVRGEQVAGEYLGSSDGDDGGWFHTRDGGLIDHDGYLYLTGRLDDVIVRGGENISPGEVESVLAEHPAVDQVAVVGVPDVEWGEQVAAAVVLHVGSVVSEDELRTWVRDRLRSSRTPAHVEFRSDLPFNETGKLLRRVLKEELAASHASRSDAAPSE